MSSDIRLITFTGASGVGKTTILISLLRRFPRCGVLESVTTRSERPAEFEGEYRHVSQEEFAKLRECDAFLEWAAVHHDYYGVLKESMDRVLADTTRIYFKAIEPSGLVKLCAYAPHAIKSFYIIAPSEIILRQRLKDRGENEEVIERRIADCKKWDEEARHSPIPYVFIKNEHTVEEIVNHIIEQLQSVV